MAARKAVHTRAGKSTAPLALKQEWARHSQWTLIEAAALATGAEPIGTDDPDEQMATMTDAQQRKAFSDIYRELKSATRSPSQAKRQGFGDVERTRTGRIGNTRVLPAEFVTWATKRGSALPKALVASVESVQQAAAETKPMTTSERWTLLVIIAALCKECRIAVDERGAATKLAELTEKFGARVSDDTVARYLKQLPEAVVARAK